MSELHVPADLPQGKQHPIPITQAEWAQSRSESDFEDGVCISATNWIQVVQPVT
jgi:hypothetical protein